MHKVFVSYHHANDQDYKEELLRLNREYPMFIDGSVDTGDISDDLDDQAIRQKIRDEYLRDTTVTILLVGTETKNRKHVDWELYSSMFDGKVNKKSAVIVITLPSTGCAYYTVAHGEKEKQRLYPGNSSWMAIDSRAEYEKRYPYLPDRIIDNLVSKKAKISVTNWKIIANDLGKLEFLINAAFDDKASCEYDLSRPMRRRDS
jgi:MTH538 TIR-like domain (DUF1863)